MPLSLLFTYTRLYSVLSKYAKKEVLKMTTITTQLKQ